MARRNYKMVFVSRNRLRRDQTKIYASKSLEDLRQIQKDLEKTLESKFNILTYNELGAVTTAIIMKSPQCIKLPTVTQRKETNNAITWRPVRFRED